MSTARRCQANFPRGRVRQVTNIASSKVEFGLVPLEDWLQPPWINETKATEAREEMVKNNVIYGGM